MAKSYAASTGDGVTNQFTVPFAYMDKSHIDVIVDGVVASFSWVNDSLIQITPTPTAGAHVVRSRSTPTAPLTAYPTSSILRGADLTRALTQSLYVAEELEDRQDRSLESPDYEASKDMTLPADRATKVLAFTSDGSPVASTKTLEEFEDYIADAEILSESAAVALQAAADAEQSAASAGSDLWSRPVDLTTNTPDGSPTVGLRRLVGTTPTGAWVGHANQVAEYFADGWHFSGVPKDGQPLWDQGAKCIRRYSTTASKWVKSLNKQVFVSWFVAASGAYDYAAADTFAAASGLTTKGDVDIDISGIAGSGFTFTGAYKPAGGIITTGSKTLTFTKFYSAPYQAFDSTGTGLITLNGVDQIYTAMFGVLGDGTDETNQMTRVLASAAVSGKPPINGLTTTSKITGALTATVGLEIRNLNLDHYPAADTSDLLTIMGGDYSPNFDPIRIVNCVFRGLQSGWTFGRDLIRISRGDHIQLKNVLCRTPKRDGVHVEPDANLHWIENLTGENVKVQNPGRHAFNFYVPDTLTNVFINQTSLIQCESRGALGSALNIQCDNTVAAANKISAFCAINCELGVNGAVSTPIVNIQGPTSGGSVENIRIFDSAVEDTTSSRTGVGIGISGRCTGSFQFKNGVIFGTAGGRISGQKQFGWYEIDTGSSSDNVFRSHSGIAEKYRTASLAGSGTENADWILNPSEILKVYAGDRFSTWGWRGEWTVFGTTAVAAVGTPSNLSLAIVTSGSDKVLQITNTSVSAAQIELFIKREVADTAT